MSAMDRGDTLVVWRLDRLGRSLNDLIAIIDELGKRGIEFVSLTESIDTTSAGGRQSALVCIAIRCCVRSTMPGRRMMAANRKRQPHPVDIHVGQQLRRFRQLCGLSQSAVADVLGITFPQIQKYERGVDRISASRLFYLSRLFNVEVDDFFEDLDDTPARSPDDNLLRTTETLYLVRRYYRLPEPLRSNMRLLIKSIADQLNIAE